MTPPFAYYLVRLAQGLLTAERVPQPGDFVRIAGSDPRRRIGPEELSFRDIWFPYLPAAGLARVTGRARDGLEVELWLRPMLVWRPRGAFRPLNRLGRALARERIGLWLMQQAIARAAPPDDDPARPGPPKPLGWWQRRAARARGGLGIVQALGGRWPTWPGIQLWLFLRRLARLTVAYPEDPRHGPHGLLITRCTAILRVTGRGTDRVFRLDQVRRHPNGNIHLLGRLLPSGEPRSFSLNGIERIDVDGLGEVDTDALWVELQALTETAAGHHRIWAGWCAERGFPVPPAPGRMARTFERLRQLTTAACHRFQRRRTPRLVTAADLRRPGFRPKVWWLQRRNALRRRARGLRWHLRDLWGLPRPKPGLRSGDARWRGFLHDLADRVGAGDPVDPRLLLGLHKLRLDPLFARSLLRAMLHEERRHLAGGDPRLLWIDEALALSPDHRRVIPDHERRAAEYTRDLMKDVALAEGPTRWNRIRRNGRDPVLLLVDCVIQAIYAPERCGQQARGFEPCQQPLKTPFLAAIFLFAAEWDGTRWHLPSACAPRLRWLARFG